MLRKGSLKVAKADIETNFLCRSGMGGIGDVTTLDTFGDSWKVDR